MRLESIIYCESDGEPDELWLPNNFSIHKIAVEERTLTETHLIYTLDKYYIEGYERGPWPRLCGVLMSLFASQNVKKVWYFSDDKDLGNSDPIDIDNVLRISKHYMKYGKRPYNQSEE